MIGAGHPLRIPKQRMARPLQRRARRWTSLLFTWIRGVAIVDAISGAGGAGDVAFGWR
jgi:hypothetical protein